MMNEDDKDMNQAEPQKDNMPEPEGHSEEESVATTEETSDTLHPEDRITELEAELARTKDHMLRALADAENTRKRALREREDAGKYAISSFARDLLDFADNFHRALEAFPADLKEADERAANVMTGIESMEKALMSNFEKHGITKIEPIDVPFDPNFHEVMFETPGTGKPAGMIIQLIEPGYVIKDRLLRPARVGVAKDEGQGKVEPSSDEPGSQVDTEA